MRVLITVPWGERLGGAEVMLQTLLDGASTADFELVFLQDGAWPAELRAAGFRVEVIPAGRLREPHRLLRCVVALARLLRARRPDLILSWMPKAHLYSAPAALLAGMGGRLLWWQHQIAEGHPIDRIATLLPARAVGCCSQATAQAQRRLRPRRPTLVVAAGVAPPHDDVPGGSAGVPGGDAGAEPAGHRGAASGGGAPLVGLVGRLHPLKGQDRLLRAQALLRDRGVELRTIFVGADAHELSSDYAAGLPRLVDELGLKEASCFTGQVGDAGSQIARMDVLVSASLSEGFGLVLLEAMARGVPVVAVDSGGPAEILDGGRAGLLVAESRPAALAEAIERLLADPALRERLAQAGRSRYLEQYTDVAFRERMLARLRALAHEARQ